MSRPRRILIVEDNRAIARDLELRLARLGYAIAGATAYAEDAIELAAGADLVLMDIRLAGEMDGIAAAAQIRARHAMPVVFLTAFADDATLRAAEITEPFGYVIKPAEDRELRVVIEMALYKDAAERERRRLAHQVRRAEQLDAIGLIAGGIAHDFNNVLTAILSNSRALADELGGHPRVAAITMAAERAARLTRQLLAFGHDDPEQPVALDLAAHVDRTLAILAPVLGDGLTIERAIAPDLRAVLARSAELEQLVMNLVLNARDAMPGGGTIAIAARDEGDDVVLTVRDTGHGMDAATRAHIFEPFFTTKPVGTGLGLATVSAVVERSGGRIDVTSALGAGTTFTIWLPATAAIPVEAAPPADEAIQLAGTLVVVEDDAQVRAVIREILEQAGLRVIEATDGLDALRVCRAHPGEIDLVLSDLVMPRLGGADLARSLAADAPTTKVVYMSGYPGRSPAARDAGPILHKPFTPGELLAWVRDALESRAA
jgi:signal transduction histidine kinase